MGGPKCHRSILRNDHVPCHYLFNLDVDFKITQYCMSILIRNSPCCVVYFNSHVTKAPCRMSILRNAHVALSNLGVKGHTRPAFTNTLPLPALGRGVEECLLKYVLLIPFEKGTYSFFLPCICP